MQRAWIISIGTELTLGQTVDTNAAWLAERLAAVGVRTERHVTVADETDAVRDAFLQAAQATDLIIATGGLGPTDDDITRAALAAAAGVELETDPESVERIQAYFAARGRQMPERNKLQALRPCGARILPNDCGTAPGLRIELGATPCFVLPGVPFEMKEMYAASVAPALRAAARGRVLRSRRLNCFGIGESDVGERIADLMTRGRNPEVGTTAELGAIGIRINAAGPSPDEVDLLLDQTERELRDRLGTYVFGRESDTLASVVGELLKTRNLTVSTAESCTGGLIAKLLTDASGSSAFFLGSAVTYSNKAKQRVLGVEPTVLESHGAVSEATARAMLAGARTAFQSACAVSLTGIAGPSGGSPEKPVGLVYIGVATPHGDCLREYRFGSDAPRDVIRERAAKAALNLLRLELL